MPVSEKRWLLVIFYHESPRARQKVFERRLRDSTERRRFRESSRHSFEEGRFTDTSEHEFVRKVCECHASSKEKIEEWLRASARVPRASDLWDLPSGLCGHQALRRLRAPRETAERQPPPQRDGRHGARGPRNGNLDEVSAQGLAILGDLLERPPGERDNRALAKGDLEKLCAFLKGDWYPAQMSHEWLLDAVGPLLAQKYPELSHPDAPELERLPESPMSAHGGGGEDEDLLDLDDGNALAEKADVSMADRSVDDISLAELALLL